MNEGLLVVNLGCFTGSYSLVASWPGNHHGSFAQLNHCQPIFITLMCVWYTHNKHIIAGMEGGTLVADKLSQDEAGLE